MPNSNPEAVIIAAFVSVVTVVVRTTYDLVIWLIKRTDKKDDPLKGLAHQEEQKLMLRKVEDIHTISTAKDATGRPLIYTTDPLMPEKIREMRAMLDRLDGKIDDVERRLLEHDQWNKSFHNGLIMRMKNKIEDE